MNKLNHIAFIMDGNGRWGKNKNKGRNYGQTRVTSDTEGEANRICVRHPPPGARKTQAKTQKKQTKEQRTQERESPTRLRMPTTSETLAALLCRGCLVRIV